MCIHKCVYINDRLSLKPWMPYNESGFEGTLEPYMVISENFIKVPGWDERTPPNKNNNKNNNNNNIYIYKLYIINYIQLYIAIYHM